jgi:hypothetical protein
MEGICMKYKLGVVRSFYKLTLNDVLGVVGKYPIESLTGYYQAALASRFRRVVGAYGKNMTYDIDPNSFTKILDRNLNTYTEPAGSNSASRALGPTYSDLRLKGKSSASVFKGSFNTGGKRIVSEEIEVIANQIISEYEARPRSEFVDFFRETTQLKNDTSSNILKIREQYKVLSKNLTKVDPLSSPDKTLEEIHNQLNGDDVLFNSLTKEVLRSINGSDPSINLFQKPNFQELGVDYAQMTKDKGIKAAEDGLGDLDSLIQDKMESISNLTKKAVELGAKAEDLSSLEELGAELDDFRGQVKEYSKTVEALKTQDFSKTTLNELNQKITNFSEELSKLSTSVDTNVVDLDISQEVREGIKTEIDAVNRVSTECVEQTQEVKESFEKVKEYEEFLPEE